MSGQRYVAALFAAVWRVVQKIRPQSEPERLAERVVQLFKFYAGVDAADVLARGPESLTIARIREGIDNERYLLAHRARHLRIKLGATYLKLNLDCLDCAKILETVIHEVFADPDAPTAERKRQVVTIVVDIQMLERFVSEPEYKAQIKELGTDLEEWVLTLFAFQHIHFAETTLEGGNKEK